MRKNSVTAVTLSAAAGLVGLVLRRIEYNTALHGGVGIADERLPVTFALAALSAAMVLLSVLYAYNMVKKSGKKGNLFGEAPGAIAVVFGDVLFAFGAGIYYMGNKENLTPTVLIFTIMAVICAASFWITARPSGDDGGMAKLMCVVPSLFFCLWLVLIYKENSMEPQLIKFVYRCLDVAALTMFFYYISGYYYGRGKPAPAIVSGMLSIYFSLLVLAELGTMWNVLMISGALIIVCVGLARLINSLEE